MGEAVAFALDRALGTNRIPTTAVWPQSFEIDSGYRNATVDRMVVQSMLRDLQLAFMGPEWIDCLPLPIPRQRKASPPRGPHELLASALALPLPSLMGSGFSTTTRVARLLLHQVHVRQGQSYPICLRNMSWYDGMWKKRCLALPASRRSCRDQDVA